MAYGLAVIAGDTLANHMPYAICGAFNTPFSLWIYG